VRSLSAAARSSVTVSVATLSAATLLLSGCLVGDPGAASLWRPTPGNGDIAVRAALPYGPLPAQRFNFYPRDGDGDGRTIIFFHGGGWMSGDRSFVPPVLADLVHRGWNVISSSYRLTCTDAANPLCTTATFPDEIGDVKLVVRAVKAEAADLGVDPDRIVLAGHSAGGHLATIAALSPGFMEPPASQMDAATRAQTSAVRGYVNFNGPTDMQSVMTNRDQMGGAYLAPSASALFPSCVLRERHTAVCDDDEVAQASAATWLDADDPPGYVLAGGTDTLVPASTQAIPYEALATRVTGDAGRVWLDVAETGGHDFALVNDRMLRRWLDQTVR
jgi:acetyl esterase/lipase